MYVKVVNPIMYVLFELNQTTNSRIVIEIILDVIFITLYR
jgi:hypothetical protein